jgi:putative DNA-invertase from lambdoid prophage Rac
MMKCVKIVCDFSIGGPIWQSNQNLASAAGNLILTMLAAVAEMERDLLVERTQAGLERAKSQGKVLGRPTKTTAVLRIYASAAVNQLK